MWDWIPFVGYVVAFVGSSTSPHWSPISCVLPVPGRFGSLRAEVGLGCAGVGLFRRFRPPPPPRVWFRSSVGLRFSFPLPFQGLPAPGQVCLCWCFLFVPPLFLCVPRPAFRLSNSHLIFMLNSPSFLVILIFISWHFHALHSRVCVCGTSEQT